MSESKSERMAGLPEFCSHCPYHSTVEESLKTLRAGQEDAHEIARTVAEVKRAVDGVADTATRVYDKIVGTMDERGILARMEDFERRLEQLRLVEKKVEKLWEMRIRILAIYSAGMLAVFALWEIIKAKLIP